jgi:hypothetical protein
MTTEQITALRLAELKALGTFLGLADVSDEIPVKRLRDRLKEVLADYNEALARLK